MAQHCPECGFANADGANYCQRCGAFLAHSDPPPDTTTATYKLGETGELEEIQLDDVIERGPALVIRSGGGGEQRFRVYQTRDKTILPGKDCSGVEELGSALVEQFRQVE